MNAQCVICIPKVLQNAECWMKMEEKHLQNLTTKIVSMQKPVQFIDVMPKGAFKSMKHRHIFKTVNGKTLMTDIFEFESPLGIIGKLFNAVFLTGYLKKFLLKRNEMIKTIAESSTHDGIAIF